jgi:hypothetical protein
LGQDAALSSSGAFDGEHIARVSLHGLQLVLLLALLVSEARFASSLARLTARRRRRAHVAGCSRVRRPVSR